MDVFQLRAQVVGDYARYMSSFIELRNDRVQALVREQISTLWPEPLVQLNPSFEPGESMQQLVADGLLHPACREIFQIKRKDAAPEPLRLYRHQIEGIHAARAGDNYVLTTGTGSGKSLSYIVPIVDHVLRTRGQGRRGIQAIVVYPMNALANSQLEELRKYIELGFDRPLVRFARYTGQESHERREQILADPPDILLTNYVMLELVLTRPEERRLIEAAANLRFLVFDELHTYRGRQGADVAMLCRRVRDACRAQHLIHVGTSATLASDSNWDDQRRAVATVASLIFGAPVEPRRVVGETLRRITPEFDFDDPDLIDRLRRQIDAGTVPEDHQAFAADPVAAWIESTLGIRLRDGRLVRQQPRPVSGPRGAAHDLASLTGAVPERCEAAISATLMAGYRHQVDGRPLFAFRLHQFIARGDTVYASLASEDDRFLTMQVQQYVPGSNRDKLLLPLCFCRECGQEFYSVRRGLLPDDVVSYSKRDVSDQLDSEEGEAGYLYINTKTPWPSDDPAALLRSLPESWLEDNKGKLQIRSERKKNLPQRIVVSELGIEGQGDLPAHFIRAPFLFCPTCGVAYDARQKSDFGKLGTLGSEGRSTATTLLSLSTLRHLRHTRGLGPSARKLLSFTDNRQDAALQAGHFNDFVSLGLVRSGLYRALDQAGDDGIRHDKLPQKVFEALDLPIRLYAQNPEVLYGQREATQRALGRVLGYSIYRDLARGWRLTSPNLEQCGLLTIEYRDVAALCADADLWKQPLLIAAGPALRRTICEVLLNYLRRELAIQIEFLEPTTQEQIRLDSNQLLIDPWRLGDTERLVQNFHAVPASSTPRARDQAGADGGRFVYVSARGGFGQYLRRSNVLGAFGKLTLVDTGPIIEEMFSVLAKGPLHEVQVGRRGGSTTAYQLKAEQMIWHRGNGETAAHDPIRVPQTPDQGLRPNSFFIDFYRSDTRDLNMLHAHEHTAQVRADERERRETSFRKAELPLLFCSPTMELGVDIAELNVVNMRNVPPTPANYAQRSGRAGRSGQPAFVFTYCTASSPHDHYFFRHPERMVAGEVSPPRLDLANEDLLRAHVHAIWLAESGLRLGSTLADLLDVSGDNPTLEPNSKVSEALQDPAARARAHTRATAAIGSALSDLFPNAPDQADGWLHATLDGLPTSFRNACERWCSLFRAAHSQVRKQRAAYDDRSLPHAEREKARRLIREAESQLDLLVDRGAELNSDFYSYRYFASEGFLPGYNFPRLPLSAYLPSPRRRLKDHDEFLSRPRFLAVSEFGPQAIIYHEGSRYVIGKVILGADAEAAKDGGLLARVLRCELCGYVETLQDATAPDFCPDCGGGVTGVDTNLFRMRNVTAHRRDRITSDEEERLRIGYDLRTNIHFTRVDGRPRKAVAQLLAPGDELLATLTYGHAADVWRINLGWRRRKPNEVPGFLLDTQTGAWVRSQNPEDPDADPDEPTTPRQTRVIPYVRDTRNCLIFDLTFPLDKKPMAALQAAVKTAIQLEFQLEDRELAAEPLPSRADRRRILLYEAAEGGAGVLRRLVDEPTALARVARRALELCHFDPDTLADLGKAPGAREECVAACYDCLLSYFNQTDHSLVDRHDIVDILRTWLTARVESSPTEAPRTDHVSALLHASDSDLERRWLALLRDHGHRLPHRAQVFITEANTRVDFLYEPTGARVAIYIDGPPHDSPDVARQDIQHQEALEDFGYTVIRFHHATDWAAILARLPHVFGAPEAPTPASPPPPASKAPSANDPLIELLDYFDDPWHPLIRQLAAVPGLVVDAGGDLGDRVAASYVVRVDQDERSVFILDRGDPRSAKAAELLDARSRRAVTLTPADPDGLTKILEALRT